MPERVIFVVEDDPEDLELTRIALSEILAAYSWRTARDGVEALEYLLSNSNPPPALVLLDLKLPRMDGLKLLRRLQEEWGPQLRGLKVAVLSSSYEASDRATAESLGARLYLRKPITPEDTKAMVRGLCALLGAPGTFSED